MRLQPSISSEISQDNLFIIFQFAVRFEKESPW